MTAHIIIFPLGKEYDVKVSNKYTIKLVSRTGLMSSEKPNLEYTASPSKNVEALNTILNHNKNGKNNSIKIISIWSVIELTNIPASTLKKNINICANITNDTHIIMC